MPLSPLLVTGARGFIGRQVLDLAEAAGWQAVPFAGDVLDPKAWDAVPDGVAAVVHLAAALGPARFAVPEAVARAARINVAGTEAARRFCLSRGARLVLASTSGVYAPSFAPLAETSPTAPANAYARSKLAAEEVCRETAEVAGLRGVILRIFNVYGPFQPGAMLLPLVLKALLAGRPVSLRSPQSRRDHLHVHDAAAALLAAAALDRPGLTLLNLGTGQAVTNTTFAGLVAKVWDRPLDLSPSPTDQVPDCYLADTARTREVLGFEASLELEEGLRLTRLAMA